MVTFYTKFFGIMGLTYGYVGWRLTAGVTSTLWDVVVIAGIVALYVAAPITWRLRSRDPDEVGVRPATQLFFVTAGLMLLCAAMLIVRDVGWLLAWAVGALPESSDRLLHQSNLGLLSLLALAGLYGSYSAKRLAPVKPVDVPIDDLADPNDEHARERPEGCPTRSRGRRPPRLPGVGCPLVTVAPRHDPVTLAALCRCG